MAREGEGGEVEGRGEFELVVEKAAFKFNASHFIVHATERERLHGHNYRATISLSADAIGADGYVIDFGVLKRALTDACKDLDETFLCPTLSPHLDIAILDSGDVPLVPGTLRGPEGAKLRLRWRNDGTEWTFPAQDAVLLPVAHTSAEELARYLTHRVLASVGLEVLRAARVSRLTVGVIETTHQEARYTWRPRE
jgi:6-pyruvoyl-tetrahydropterin synthase